MFQDTAWDVASDISVVEDDACTGRSDRGRTLKNKKNGCKKKRGNVMENNFKDFDTTPTLTLDPFQTAEEKQEPAVVEEKKEEVIAEENVLSEEERQMAEKFAEQIDLTNSNMILQYGAGTQKRRWRIFRKVHWKM